MSEISAQTDKHRGHADGNLAKMNESIEANADYTESVLKTVEDTYSRFLQSNIVHHKYLLKMAEQDNDLQRIMHHKVLLETYETMLANLCNSSKYAKV